MFPGRGKTREKIMHNQKRSKAENRGKNKAKSAKQRQQQIQTNYNLFP